VFRNEIAEIFNARIRKLSALIPRLQIAHSGRKFQCLELILKEAKAAIAAQSDFP